MTDAATTTLSAAFSIALAPLLAATFVAGCAAIHALRRHADGMTTVLVTVALCLGAFALTMASDQPAASTADSVDPPACYGFE